VIDSVVGGLIIVKTYINLEGTDERTLKLSGQITKNSVWVVEKAASLLNFNKAYLAAQMISENLIQDSILDPKQSLSSTSSDLYPLSKSQITELT
jgi:hypothetical protein